MKMSFTQRFIPALAAAVVVSAVAMLPAQVAASVDLGGGCGGPTAPVLTIDPPALGTTVQLQVTSDHPNSPLFLLWSFGAITPTPIPGLSCVVHVDLANFMLFPTMTDNTGSYTLPVPITNDPGLLGMQLTLQARTWFPGGPIPQGDHLSNGVLLTFGNPLGKIGDTVFCDTNNDGVQGANEPGLPGVSVRLTCANSGAIQTMVTDNNGEYCFTDLPPDMCTVTVDPSTAPSGKVPGICPTTVMVNLLAGETYLDADFCFVDQVANEGCTPGYWRQPHHFQNWPSAYSPSMNFTQVFENAFPGKSLLDVVQLGGGQLNALGRHTVAALLNGGSTVNYGLSAAQVIQMFNDVYPGSNSEYENLKNFFEGLNERGCPF